MRQKLLWVCAVLAALIPVAVPAQTPEEIEQLLDKLVVSNRLPDETAMNELIKIGKPVVTPILKRLKKDRNASHQQYYLMVLYTVGDESITGDILRLSRSKSGNVREWSIYSLAKFGNQQSIPVLIRALNDSAIDSESKEFIAKRLQKLTGQSIDYRANMTLKQRQQAYEEWREWWRLHNEETGPSD